LNRTLYQFANELTEASLRRGESNEATPDGKKMMDFAELATAVQDSKAQETLDYVFADDYKRKGSVREDKMAYVEVPNPLSQGTKKYPPGYDIARLNKKYEYIKHRDYLSEIEMFYNHRSTQLDYPEV
jgi:hypothetical protein